MSFESLYFEEIDGRKRKVLLQGTEAPKGHMRGEPAFHLKQHLRRGKKYAIGARRPDVHIGGVEFDDLVIRVHFRDSLTGEEGGALRRMELINAIHSDARPLRIVWGKVLRLGLLAEPDFGVEAEGEFEATLTFEIHDDGQPVRRKTRRRPLGIPSAVEELASFIETAKGVKIPGLHLDFGSTLDDLFSAIASPLTALAGLAEDILSTGEDVSDDVASVKRRLFQVANRAKELQRRTGELFGFLTASNDPTDTPEDSAAWRRAQADALEALGEAMRAARDLGATSEKQALGTSSGRIYEARAGDTAEQIADRFGTSMEALKALNPSLPTGPIPPGTKIRLP